MASIFSKDPTARPPLPPYAIERIQREIDHLKKRTSVRTLGGSSLTLSRMISAIALCSIIALYFMDPFLYAYHKGDAIRTYLYLHNHGSEEKAQTLASTGIFTENEVNDLRHRQGSFQDYFSSPQQAEQTADSIMSYMSGLNSLHSGQYDRLDPIGKLRYILFVRTGLFLPSIWSGLNPSVISE